MRAELPEVRPAGRYTTSQAAEILGVDRHTIMRWHRLGELRGSAYGKRRYFKGADLIRAYHTH